MNKEYVLRTKMKKSLVTSLFLVLFFTATFIGLGTDLAYGATETVEKQRTITFNDIGSYSIWKHSDGTWQKGIRPGSFVSNSINIPISTAITSKLVGTRIDAIEVAFNKSIATDYEPFYVNSADILNYEYSTSIGQIQTVPTGSLAYNYSCNLTTATSNVGDSIKEVWQGEMVEGYKYYIPVTVTITYTSFEEVEIPEVVEEIKAGVSAPASSEVGKAYLVKDVSEVPESLTVDKAVLERRVNDGTKEHVATWNGSGQTGTNTGESINESFSNPCSVEYILTVTDTNGQISTDTTIVNIVEQVVNESIEAEADLWLNPESTYEGHDVKAYDLSSFTLTKETNEGSETEHYGSDAAYKKGIAKNSYSAPGATTNKKSGYDRILTYDNSGTYNVTLKVSVGGGTLYDTESVEILKTPYILDSLGGHQKQNRKQILDIKVATNPKYPITDYYIKLTNKDTGETITIDPEHLQVNNECFKTRLLQIDTTDNYYSIFKLEFLTKTPTFEEFGYKAGKFCYEILMKDAKGETGYIKKNFDVMPDIPPVAEIDIENMYLREAESNIAEIRVRDTTMIADGDQLDRTWYLEEYDPYSNLPLGTSVEITPSFTGYKDFSFGTKQSINFKKEGVGTFGMKLHLKEVWVEETLEEYISPGDYLTATTTIASVVENVKPIVSISPVFYDTANVIIMVNDETEAQIKERVTTLKKQLLNEGVNASIQVVQAKTPNNDGLYVTSSYDMTDKILSTTDSTQIYFSNADFSISAVKAISAHKEEKSLSENNKIQDDSNNNKEINESGEYENVSESRTDVVNSDTKSNSSGDDGQRKIEIKEVWSYSSLEPTKPVGIQVDNLEKYVYLIYSNKTVLLNRNTGAEIITFDFAVPNAKPFMNTAEDMVYFVNSTATYRLDLQKLQLKNIGAAGYCPQLIGGNLTYVSKDSISNYSIVSLDLDTETFSRKSLPYLFDEYSRDAEYGRNVWYTYGEITPVDMDSEGRVLFYQLVKDDDNRYIEQAHIWMTDYNTQRSSYMPATILTSTNNSYSFKPSFVKDELGKAQGVLYDAYAYKSTRVTSNGKTKTKRYYYRQFNIWPITEGMINNGRGKTLFNFSTSGETWPQDITVYANYSRVSGNYNFFMNGYGSSLYKYDNDLNLIETSGINYGKTFIDNGDIFLSQNGSTLNLLNESITEEMAKEGALQKYVYGDGFGNYITDVITDAKELAEQEFVNEVIDYAKHKESIKVSLDGSEGALYKDLRLESGKTYYYEYDVKSISDKKADTNIDVQYKKNCIDDSEYANYIVLDQEVEDFTDTFYNKYFTFSGLRRVNGKWLGCEMMSVPKGSSQTHRSSSGSCKFTVPEGKEALLSFDYVILAETCGNTPANPRITIDGQHYFAYNPSNTSGHYVHPILLGAGEHTLSCYTGDLTSLYRENGVLIDNLKVEYVKKVYKDEQVRILRASEGKEQTYTASEDGKYHIVLYGPSSDASGGKVEGEIYLKSGDVLKAYLGPQVIKATGSTDGANGVDGSGYGDEGEYKAELYLNDTLIAVAGGSGSDGNSGIGDGSYIGKTKRYNSSVYVCTSCGKEHASYPSRYCTAGKCYSKSFSLTYKPCASCGNTAESHYHYSYYGKGGVGGKAVDAGLNTATSGENGGEGNKAYSSGMYDYAASGKGGDAGKSGASWIDSSKFLNARLIRGGSFDQSKLYIKYLEGTSLSKIKENAFLDNVEEACSEQVTHRENGTYDGWTRIQGEINTATKVETYTQLKYETCDFERDSSVTSPYVLVKQQGSEADGKLVATFPSDYISVMQRYRTYSGYTGTVMAFMTYNGSSLQRGDDSSKEGYGDDDRYNSVPADYTICVPLKNTTDTLIAQHSYKKGSTSFVSSKSMLLPEDDVKSHAALQGRRYFYDDSIESIFFENSTFDGEVRLGIVFHNTSDKKQEYLIDNFKIYYIENGVKKYLPATTESMSDFLEWESTGNITVEKFTEKEEEQKYNSIVYKKGELVGYDIYYADFENDPKNEAKGKSFWLYAHEPFNDGEHENAAFIHDDEGNIVKICGMDAAQAVVNAGIELATDEAITLETALKIAIENGRYTLSEYIPKFYVDGRYNVYHWTYDDTSRGKLEGGYPLWDAMSNIAELPFYIDGTANAPWIVNISTSPTKVTEGNKFKINVKIDDVEKDILSLTTQVYKDKKLIYTHRKKGIEAVNGIYPTIVTDTIPYMAEVGVYEVVCTVRDETGAGVETHTFKVISDYKITGLVYHTEQWESNRKKYNLKNFGEEVNRAYSYNEYLALSLPRKRGTNVFWAGERFMLKANVVGKPTKVTCQIKGTSYKTTLINTGKKNDKNETIYSGSLWNSSFNNKWGIKKPEELTFIFTSNYAGGIEKVSEVKVITDNLDQYWKLHRVY